MWKNGAVRRTQTKGQRKRRRESLPAVGKLNQHHSFTERATWAVCLHLHRINTLPRSFALSFHLSFFLASTETGTPSLNLREKPAPSVWGTETDVWRLVKVWSIFEVGYFMHRCRRQMRVLSAWARGNCWIGRERGNKRKMIQTDDWDGPSSYFLSPCVTVCICVH